MRIDLFKLYRYLPPNFDLEQRIQFILGKVLQDRVRSKGVGDYIRLEAAEKRDGKWLLDFILMRTKHGPAKVGMNEPATGFPLDSDEGFGEETAFLWDPSNDWCVVQYNHHGVRSRAITDYLGNFDSMNHATLELVPKLDPEVHAKIRNKRLITKFTVNVVPQVMTDFDYNLGSSMNDAINSIKPTDAERLEISISASKKKGLQVSLEPIFEMFQKHQAGPIKGAHAVVRSNMDDEPESIDLLSNRILREEEITAGSDKRYPLEDRWNALLRAHNGWRNLMT